MSENYITFTAVDFAEDSFFIHWVNHPDEESDGFWESFLTEHPEKLSDIEEARKVVSLLSFRTASMDEASYTSMRNGLISSIREERHKEHRASQNRGSFRWKQLLKVAAVLLVSLTGVAIYQAGKQMSTEPMGTATTSPSEKDTPTEERTNPRGQKSVLILPDGSKVWLSVDSKLTYNKDFGGAGRREVRLEGEAFFNVVHNDTLPFIVHTSSSIRIAVLGTSFNVKSYKEDETVETTLVEGKVSIDKLERNGEAVANLILQPNQRAVFFKESNTLNVQEVNATNVSAWRHDYLVFEETPFTAVLTQLERWYDVTIHLPEDDKSNLPCTLTANIQQESLEDVLKLLETSHRITYSIRGNEVFIYGKICKD